MEAAGGRDSVLAGPALGVVYTDEEFRNWEEGEREAPKIETSKQLSEGNNTVQASQ